MRPRVEPKSETGSLLRRTTQATKLEDPSIHCKKEIKARVRRHSTERPWVRLTPAPEPQGDPSIDFQPVMKVKT